MIWLYLFIGLSVVWCWAICRAGSGGPIVEHKVTRAD